MPSPDRWSDSSSSQSTSPQPTKPSLYSHSHSYSSSQSRRDSTSLYTSPDGADKIYNIPGNFSSSSSGGAPGKSKSGWMRQVKSWVSTSEPSAQAIKSQRRETYKKHGVHLSDPNAAAKMHLPIGVLPRGATTSTSGPTPEKKLQRECKERPRLGSGNGGGRKHTSSSQSISSGYSSGGASSTGRGNVVAPWA